jgi:hypothetical protein
MAKSSHGTGSSHGMDTKSQSFQFENKTQFNVVAVVNGVPVDCSPKKDTSINGSNIDFLIPELAKQKGAADYDFYKFPDWHVLEAPLKWRIYEATFPINPGRGVKTDWVNYRIDSENGKIMKIVCSVVDGSYRDQSTKYEPK